MNPVNKNAILCLTRDEYEQVIKNTKDVFVFETASTDPDLIHEVFESLPVWQMVWINEDEIFGVVFVDW